jgi:hypothetical protein
LGRVSRAFQASHHNIAFDGTDAPRPRSAALLQDCFKDLKLVRRHSKIKGPAALFVRQPPLRFNIYSKLSQKT